MTQPGQPSPAPRIRLEFKSVQAMEAELQRNLRTGGAFCPGAAPLPERASCVLVLVHPNGTCLELQTEVVFVKPDEPGRGIGLHLNDFGPAVLERVRQFLQQPYVEASGPAAEECADGVEHDRVPQNLHDRLKGLSVAAQQRIAREGALPERIALERIYGKSVWEGLLHNPRISPPEVARIARMGLATAAMLDAIASNATWLASGEVRRAILSNPRLSEECVAKVLRCSPRHEVHLIASQTVYQARVRKVAKALLSRG